MSQSISYGSESLTKTLSRHVRLQNRFDLTTPAASSKIVSTMPRDTYVVIVSGQRFIFTRDQLESEPGNYFATYFLGDFNEATNSTNELELETEPLLFEPIQAHLRGYTIFPIQDTCIPKYMSKMGMLKSLRKEADYFGLENLVGSIDEELVSAAECPMNGEMQKMTAEGSSGRRVYQLWASFHFTL